MRAHDQYFSLGIDIGSVSLSFALLNAENRIVQNGYCFHYGNIRSCLQENLVSLNWSDINAVGFNQRAAEFFKCGVLVNDQIAH